MRPAFLLVGLALLALTLPGCGDGPRQSERPARDIPHVYTASYPTTYWAQRIAGEKAQVIHPLPREADPRLWRPAPDIVARYQDDADLILVHGAGLEAWIARRSLPRARLVDTSRAIAERLIKRRSPIKHTHGGREHTHVEVDEHAWLDPALAKQQAKAIHAALRDRFPQHAAAYERGYEALARDLDALDAAFRELGPLPDGAWIYAAHPTYGYLARAYGWRVVDLDLDPERVPSDEELEAIATSVNYKPGRALWWERAPSDAVAQAIRTRTGLESRVFDPCLMPPPEGGDYITVMRANVERARSAFAP